MPMLVSIPTIRRGVAAGVASERALIAPRSGSARQAPDPLRKVRRFMGFCTAILLNPVPRSYITAGRPLVSKLWEQEFSRFSVTSLLIAARACLYQGGKGKGGYLTSQPMKPRVMVVDDNAANRTAFQSILEGAYTVHLADSGHVALQLSLNHEFALILLDVRMPLMDGFETAALLRARERTRETPIIFLSAYELTVDQIKEAYVAGATDFLPRPVDQELLQFKVAAYVRLYLRNESIRAQLHHLESLVETLQVEANLRVGALEPSFKSKIDQLEGLIGGLHRQLMTSVQ